MRCSCPEHSWVSSGEACSLLTHNALSALQVIPFCHVQFDWLLIFAKLILRHSIFLLPLYLRVCVSVRSCLCASVIDVDTLDIFRCRISSGQFTSHLPHSLPPIGHCKQTQSHSSHRKHFGDGKELMFVCAYVCWEVVLNVTFKVGVELVRSKSKETVSLSNVCSQVWEDIK